jgi:hypothetical protein
MKTQSMASSSSVNITMIADAFELEGVVTALGIKREKALGYATQQVSGEEVSDVKSSNFVNSLSGKVAGLDIKSSGISVGLLK